VFGLLEVLSMKKIISILLAYCILLLPTGCSTSKLLSMKEASLVKNKKYLVLHTPTKTYNLYNYNFSENSLDGSLAAFSKDKKARIHVYTNQIFDLKPTLEYDQFISLKDVNIQSINYSKPRGEKAFIITIASVVSFFILASVLTDGPITNLELSSGSK